MNEKHIEDIITALYDLIQDARGLPLGADKCIVERDKVLDMLDEIIAQLPGELKQSRTIVESRNELISQARREAEVIIRQAQEKAAKSKKSSAGNGVLKGIFGAVVGAVVTSVTSSIGTEVSKKVTGKKSKTTAKDIAGKAVGSAARTATRQLTRSVLGTLLK